MSLWAVIPVKPADEGKSRLAGALPPQARERLNITLFHRTLDTLGAILPAANIIIISRDGAFRDSAISRGMRAITEQGHTLNGALYEAARIVGHDAMLAISTDLPELTPDDVRAMLPAADQPGRAMTIAPDRARHGTNALFTAPAACIPFRFGNDSFSVHLNAARDAGIEPGIITRPGLAFDLDLPEDLKLLRFREDGSLLG